MSVSMDQLADLPPEAIRQALPGFLRAHVRGTDALRDAFAARARAVLDDTPGDALAATLTTYARAGDTWRLHEADPVARRLSRSCMQLLCEQPEVRGTEYLVQAVAGGPCLVVGNHLSYVDTQIADVVLAQAGLGQVADTLVTVAGPKVFSDPFRRIAAISLGTLLTAQSTQLGENAAKLSAREVAQIAVGTMRTASELMAQGRPVLLYPEGSRSRSGRLGSFLRAAARYARTAHHILPLAVTGGERVFAMDHGVLVAAPVRVVVGEPVAVGSEAADALSCAWSALAAMLPNEYRPDPTTRPLC